MRLKVLKARNPMLALTCYRTAILPQVLVFFIAQIVNTFLKTV